MTPLAQTVQAPWLNGLPSQRIDICDFGRPTLQHCFRPPAIMPWQQARLQPPCPHTCVRFAPFRLACPKLARLRLDPVKLASSKLAPNNDTSVRSEPLKLAPLRLPLV